MPLGFDDPASKIYIGRLNKALFRPRLSRSNIEIRPFNLKGSSLINMRRQSIVLRKY